MPTWSLGHHVPSSLARRIVRCSSAIPALIRCAASNPLLYQTRDHAHRQSGAATRDAGAIREGPVAEGKDGCVKGESSGVAETEKAARAAGWSECWFV